MSKPVAYERVKLDRETFKGLAEPLEQMQDAIEAATEGLDKAMALEGVVLADKALVAGSNSVRHTLGRAPSIVLAGCPSVESIISVSEKSSGSLTVVASVACTCSFWVM